MVLAKNTLKARREKASLSQEALADAAGVTRQTIISIEQGRYVPSLELALRLARRFKCRVEDIFGI